MHSNKLNSFLSISKCSFVNRWNLYQMRYFVHLCKFKKQYISIEAHSNTNNEPTTTLQNEILDNFDNFDNIDSISMKSAVHPMKSTLIATLNQLSQSINSSEVNNSATTNDIDYEACAAITTKITANNAIETTDTNHIIVHHQNISTNISTDNKKVYDLIHELKNRIQLLPKHDKISLFKNAYIVSEVKHPSSKEKESLALVLGMSVSAVNQLLKKFRYEIYDHQFSSTNSSNNLNNLNNYILETNNTDLSPQLNDLSDIDLLNSKTNKTYKYNQVSQIPNALKEEITKIFIDPNIGLNKSSWKHIREMASKLGVTKRQLYRLIQRLKSPKQKFTKEKKEIIKNWAMNHEGLPSKLEMARLIQESKLSEDQIRYVLRSERDPTQELTQEKKQEILNWLKNHSFNTASSIEILEFTKKIGISRQQFRDFCYYISSSKKEITEELKEFCLNKFKKLNYNLTSNDIHELHKDTGLHKKQIYWLLRRFSQNYSIISDYQREIIKDWLKNNNNKIPTSEEYSELQEQTGLIRKQLTDLVRYYRFPKGSITHEKRSHIEEFIKKKQFDTNFNQMPKLDSNEVSLLAKELNLSIFQIRNIVRNIFKKSFS